MKRRPLSREIVQQFEHATGECMATRSTHQLMDQLVGFLSDAVAELEQIRPIAQQVFEAQAQAKEEEDQANGEDEPTNGRFGLRNAIGSMMGLNSSKEE